MFPDLNWPDFQAVRSEGRVREILECIEDSGIYIAPNFIPLSSVTIWRAFAERQWAQNNFRNSHIGKRDQQIQNAEIRSDKILWVDPFSGPTRPIGKWLEALSSDLRDHFRVSIPEIESHFSFYSANARYDRHIDNAKGENSRVFTFIFYLNPDWKLGDGGELVIYDPGEPMKSLFRIAPTAGTFVLFRSELFYHEVLNSKVPRFALTGWLRRHA